MACRQYSSAFGRIDFRARQSYGKVGLDVLDFFKHSFFVSTGRGSFTFNGQYTGGKGNVQNEFADFLLGDIYSDTYGNGNE